VARTKAFSTNDGALSLGSGRGAAQWQAQAMDAKKTAARLMYLPKWVEQALEV